MGAYFVPVSADYNEKTDTLIVNFIGSEKHFYPNRTEAERALGFPCPYTVAEYKQFRKAGTTIIRLDLGGQIINPK
jgi:hypothetical protein